MHTSQRRIFFVNNEKVVPFWERTNLISLLRKQTAKQVQEWTDLRYKYKFKNIKRGKLSPFFCITSGNLFYVSSSKTVSELVI